MIKFGAWSTLLGLSARLAYSLSVFPLPLALKNRWNGSFHRGWIDPTEPFLGFALVTCGARAMRIRRRRPLNLQRLDAER
jgi:hypothetical protein